MYTLMKIMVFNTEKEAKEAERAINKTIGLPAACWVRYGRGDKRHAVPLEREDGKWFFPAPTMLWCACRPIGSCESCDPEGKGICGNATYDVIVDYTVEEMNKHEYNVLLHPELEE